MNFDLQKILASKRARRQALASKPIAEKLQILDDLRERELTIRRAARPPAAHVVRENPSTSQPKPSPTRRGSPQPES